MSAKLLNQTTRTAAEKSSIISLVYNPSTNRVRKIIQSKWNLLQSRAKVAKLHQPTTRTPGTTPCNQAKCWTCTSSAPTPTSVVRKPRWTWTDGRRRTPRNSLMPDVQHLILILIVTSTWAMSWHKYRQKNTIRLDSSRLNQNIVLSPFSRRHLCQDIAQVDVTIKKERFMCLTVTFWQNWYI